MPTTQLARIALARIALARIALARIALARFALALAASLAVSACVFGFRGEVEFADDASLVGVSTVQLELPPTELVVVGDATRTVVDWQGTWVTFAGNTNDALAMAEAAELRWETWNEVGRLSAVLPIESRDLTELDRLDVQSAGYLAHEIIGTGNVFVTGVDAHVSVDLDGGDIEIIGGTELLHVRTTRGDIELTTSAAVDASSGLGRVTIHAEVGRDMEIVTIGPVRVELGEATNYDIDIAAAGQIIVELDTASHVGAGSYRRVIGPATNRLSIRSGGGLVELAMLPG